MANNVRLSGTQTLWRSESDIRFNYVNLNQIVGACNDLEDSTLEVFSSPDGGVTWSNSQLPTFAGDFFQSDPAVDWTSDGTAWALAIGVISNPPLVANVRCFKSTDQGSTWAFDSKLSPSNTATDKASLWVDHSPASPYRDQMYAIWHDGNPTFFASRSGPGGTWNAPIQLSGGETTGTSDGSDVKTNNFGDVFAFWPSSGNQKLFVAKSTDGGATFGGPIQIGTTSGQFWYPIPAQAGRNVLIYITAGAYRTATEDFVYACWHDLAGGSGCNTTADAPGSSVSSTCTNRIWFTRSIDGGTTWETPWKINDSSALNDQFFPRLVLDQTDGKLVVVYYDTIGNPSRVDTDIWMQTSPDNGVTWSAAVKITSAESDEATATANANQYGDYIGVTGNAGSFFACWTDSRNSIEEIWGAGFTVTVLATAIANSGNFGNVCVGSFADELLTINNTGSTPLSISAIISSSPDFLAPSVLSYPLVVGPGDSIDVVIRFEPTSLGFKPATLTIISNDPAGPHVVTVSGDAPPPRLATAIADAGAFGNVCVGSFADEILTINNAGRCHLTIFDIVGSPNFLAPSVLSYPLVVGPGDSIDVVIRFEPLAPAGPKPGVITILSNDPAGPHVVPLSGVLAAPKANLIIANAGSFGDVCVGSFADEPLIVTNSGECALSITGISSSSGDFLAPEVLSYPITVGRGDALPVPIRFKPLGFGSKTGTITVTSDDPASPISVNVSGDAPPGKLTVAGSTTFGGVNAGCCADRILSICNTGDCALNVTSVHFKRRSRHWRLLNNPFPAKLRPGSCLPAVIQYRANEKCPRPCELVIESDDPATPVKFVEALAYTIWDTGCKEGCDDRRKEDCDDCRKGCCDKHPSCRQGYPCCDDDDDDEDR
jgi:Abnormal spindle-like microcephaly-assoc'd, ASPM-SPD-2-Hydin